MSAPHSRRQEVGIIQATNMFFGSIFNTNYLILPLLLSLTQSNAQVPTAGVSIVSDSDYETARPCIQTCLWYNGGLGRGGNSGFEDVGKALGCGQSPINACYCSARLTASATSYFSTCITNLCTAITDPADLSSALSIYGRYCSTANQISAAVTTTTENSPSSTNSGTSPSATSEPSQSTNAASKSGDSSTNATSGSGSQATGQSASGGLTTTSKIALGVGLGVGIPLLIMLAAILIILVRRNGSKGDNDAGMGGIETHQRS
ncbi:hypothetical protein TWF481_003041 [Arthrobotrys musiformis]|uniref:Extracellular membrane protein CFEM domain-containing protein n=1 Tax=Arthrobotrys musiformis TaxID=47236 RepID=A0AAV9VQ53_9PEZI